MQWEQIKKEKPTLCFQSSFVSQNMHHMNLMKLDTKKKT